MEIFNDEGCKMLIVECFLAGFDVQKEIFQTENCDVTGCCIFFFNVLECVFFETVLFKYIKLVSRENVLVQEWCIELLRTVALLLNRHTHRDGN